MRAAWKLFRGMADRPGGPLSFEARVDNAVVAALIGRSAPFASGAGGDTVFAEDDPSVLGGQ